VLFIDDSRDFLLNFTLQLDDDITCNIVNSPYEALEAVHKANQIEQVNQRVLTEYLDANGCPMTNSTINLNLGSIHSEVYNPLRFTETSVVVIDYAMPGMNGLEVCRKMENSPIKRILLTGRADEKMAVQAFNDGLIDMYLQKQNPNITRLINSSIHTMQMHYFQNMSDVVIKMLSIKSPNCLQDPAFIKLFNEHVKENNIVEYYLTENSGSFLMMDANAELSHFIVKTEQDLRLHYEMALDNKAPQMVLDQLQKGEKVPFFWKADDYNETVWDDWATYLYPASKLEGLETYYYSYVKNPPHTDINKDKILSYQKYLDEVDG